jgi:hypothetical protein
MADRNSSTPVLHVEVGLTLNYHNGYTWSDPHVKETINFSAPPELIDLRGIGKVMVEMVKTLPARLDVEEQKWELEQAQKEAEEAEAEAESG